MRFIFFLQTCLLMGSYTRSVSTTGYSLQPGSTINLIAPGADPTGVWTDVQNDLLEILEVARRASYVSICTGALG